MHLHALSMIMILTWHALNNNPTRNSFHVPQSCHVGYFRTFPQVYTWFNMPRPVVGDLFDGNLFPCCLRAAIAIVDHYVINAVTPNELLKLLVIVNGVSLFGTIPRVHRHSETFHAAIFWLRSYPLGDAHEGAGTKKQCNNLCVF